MTVMTKPDQSAARAIVNAPALSPVTTPKPDLISVEQAKSLDVARITDLFKSHLNPGQLHFMKLLGFHKVKIERAEGMFYIDQNGREHRQKAKTVIVCANGIGTPRLLLLSASKRFPDGLANSSGMVGKRLMMHPFSAVLGIYDEDLESWRGPFGQTISS